MTYEKKAKRILEALENSKIPLSFHEIYRERIEKTIIVELKKLDDEECNNGVD